MVLIQTLRSINLTNAMATYISGYCQCHVFLFRFRNQGVVQLSRSPVAKLICNRVDAHPHYLIGIFQPGGVIVTLVPDGFQLADNSRKVLTCNLFVTHQRFLMNCISKSRVAGFHSLWLIAFGKRTVRWNGLRYFITSSIAEGWFFRKEDLTHKTKLHIVQKPTKRH